MAKVTVKNLTRNNVTLQAFDRSSITLPPRFSGQVDEKFTNWVPLNPKEVRVVAATTATTSSEKAKEEPEPAAESTTATTTETTEATTEHSEGEG